LIHQQINAVHKIKFIICVNLLHVSTSGCHLQGIFPIKGIQTQDANVGTHRPIGMFTIRIVILKYIKLLCIKLQFCYTKTVDIRCSTVPYLFTLCMQHVHKQLSRCLWPEETSSRRSRRSVKRAGRLSIHSVLVNCFVNYKNTHGLHKTKSVTVGQFFK
jgi:hypothetical protein